MLALVSSTLRGRGEGGGDGCAESGPSPLFEPTSALFRDVINGLCSYNLALLLRGLFTDTTRPLSLSLCLSPSPRTNRARNPDRSGGNLVSPSSFSFLPFPFVPSRRFKGVIAFTRILSNNRSFKNNSRKGSLLIINPRFYSCKLLV